MMTAVFQLSLFNFQLYQLYLQFAHKRLMNNSNIRITATRHLPLTNIQPPIENDDSRFQLSLFNFQLYPHCPLVYLASKAYNKIIFNFQFSTFNYSYSPNNSFPSSLPPCNIELGFSIIFFTSTKNRTAFSPSIIRWS